MPKIEIPAPAGNAEAYLALPKDHHDGLRHPGVLFFMDAIGLRPQIEQMAQRIADWGYVVLAPNAFYRTGTVDEIAPKQDLREPGAKEAFFPTVVPHMQALTSDKSNPDTAAYIAVLRARQEVADGPMGVTGYCMGARLATRAAGNHPDDVAAVGGFHGGHLVTEDDDSPHRALAAARAEFVYGHADNDGSMPLEAVEQLGQALKAAGLTATNEIYPDAGHGYTMADTAAYQQEGAERSFRELEALFARTLR